METVAIALGSNVGDSVKLIKDALKSVQRELELSHFRASSLYRTLPVGPVEQGDFINAVCVGQTSKEPLDILWVLQSIENRMGRERSVHWGPRTMDLDLLFVGERVVQSPDLTIPHPLMHERGFVLKPLEELDLQWKHPVLDRQLEALVKYWEESHIDEESVWLLDPEPSAS